MKHPLWALAGTLDKYGNVACSKCGTVQSPQFTACVNCCQHTKMAIVERWYGNDESGEWGFAVQCKGCTKDFDFDPDVLKTRYEVVRVCDA